MTHRDDSAFFVDRLGDAIARIGSPGCVGLDPVLERLLGAISTADPAGAVAEFCAGVLDAVAGIVPAVKFQSACFERHGSAGIAALESSIAVARELGLLVILDAKRGDIGVSAGHYAAAARGIGADAITVSGYLGPETIEPYLEAGLDVFVLVRTSNPGSDAVQSQVLDDGRTVAQMMADHVAELGERWTGAGGMSRVGAVVGATKSCDGPELRRRMPGQVFLVQGFGAQGGTIEDVRSMLTPTKALSASDGVDDGGGGGGVLVTASRSVIYAFARDDPDWTVSVRRAAIDLAGQLRTLNP